MQAFLSISTAVLGWQFAHRFSSHRLLLDGTLEKTCGTCIFAHWPPHPARHQTYLMRMRTQQWSRHATQPCKGPTHFSPFFTLLHDHALRLRRASFFLAEEGQQRTSANFGSSGCSGSHEDESLATAASDMQGWVFEMQSARPRCMAPRSLHLENPTLHVGPGFYLPSYTHLGRWDQDFAEFLLLSLLLLEFPLYF